MFSIMYILDLKDKDIYFMVWDLALEFKIMI
jgi:hypothetical protein